ncbi:hypothetical protein MLD38_015581 [Melastoma candidum]|uniref:Uncharacterized protein n=1 Tax=Melastoma candidum TaxID=119954 RepID=A0ACB9RGL8_9MYRT|nr:hypothetical protein MLD38_015581 [Melastoma candidum]
MSFNQSTYQKNDHPPPPLDPLNPGRSPSFSPHRPSSGYYSKGGAPSASRSFKKSGATAVRNVYRQSQSQPQLQSRVAAQPTSSHAAIHAHPPPKPPEAPCSTGQPSDVSSASDRGGRPVPKPPSSQPSAMSYDAASPAMPVKGDASKMSFQFGSITPGFMNGMLVPARTSSAPPNLDEQRRDQAGHTPIKSNTSVSRPIGPEQQLTQTMGVVDDKSLEKCDHAATKVIKDQVLPSSSASLLQKHVVHPLSGKSIPVPFHQSSVPLQFSRPNPQIQSQGSMVTPIQFSMPLPMPIPVASAPHSVQPQMFLPGLQPHALPPHAMMHQGQGLNFGAQISSQLPPQMGNLGMGVGSYSSPQGIKFGGPRKSLVKITHPETHQEVRLDERMDTFADGLPSTRAHSNFPLQSQPIASHSANHSVNVYSNYGPGRSFFQAGSSVPLSSSQITPASHAPRSNHTMSQGPRTMPVENSQDVSGPHNRGGSSVNGSLESAHLDNAHNEMPARSVLALGTMKQETGLAGDNLMDISPKMSATVKDIEPSGVSRNYAGSSDSCIPLSDASLKQEPVSETLTTVPLPGKTEEIAPASGSVSISGDRPAIRAMSAEEGPAGLLSIDCSDAAGLRDDQSLSNSKDGIVIPSEDGRNPPDPKVHDGSEYMPGNSLLTSPIGDGNPEEDLKDSTGFSSECVEEGIVVTVSVSPAVNRGSDGAESPAIATPENHDHSKPDDTTIKGALLSVMVVKAEKEHDNFIERLEDSADQSEISSVSLECSENVVEADGKVRSLHTFEKNERTFDNRGSDGAESPAIATPENHDHSKPDDTTIKGALLSVMVVKAEKEHDNFIERLEDSADQSEISSVSLECSENVVEADGKVRSLHTFEKNERTFDNRGSDGAESPAIATPENHDHSKPDDTNIKGALLSVMVVKAEKEHDNFIERLEDSADQSEISSVSLECSENVVETDGKVRSLHTFEKNERTFDNWSVGSQQSGPNEKYSCINHDKGVDSSSNLGSIPLCTIVSSSLSASDSPLLTDMFTTGGSTVGSKVVIESALGSKANLPEKITRCDKESFESNVGSTGPIQVAGLKDNSTLETMKGRNFAAKGKKKRKEILQKADAAGATSDLYLAYKGPEDNKEIVDDPDKEMTSPDNNSKNLSAEACGEGSVVCEDSDRGKSEPDDWEDVDISTTKLESENAGQLGGTSASDVQTDCPVSVKKYSRDFLLNFFDKCRNLPENFVIKSDIAEAFIPSLSSSSVLNRDSLISPGRVDRQSGGPRLERRPSNLTDDDRWNKQPGHFAAGQNMHIDAGSGMNMGLRHGPGGKHGVLRNPRVQTPVPYIGGLLPGAMQSLGSQGGFVRNSPDADRWQRAADFHKGLIPSPHTPLQAMHKAEKKYEVGKVTDEEEAKQRQLKAILNKLTPQNFEKLFEQVKAVNIDNATTLDGLISQIFDKALMEPTFCEMYADLCRHLSQELPDFSDDDEKITFRRLLLNKCQEEFERGEREQEEADKVHEEGEAKLSEEGREEKRVKARRRMLGNIRLIGELYKKKMLTEKIMHECIMKLLGQHQTPHEEDIEALCKLMSTIGEMIDHPKARDHIDIYFERMEMLSNNMSLSSRVRFMLKDSIELRKRKWQQRRKVEGPKKIEDVHRDAAQERHAHVGRLSSRSPATNPSARRGMPMDFSPRVSNVSLSRPSHMGGVRGSQDRGYGIGHQDVRFGESQSFEVRPLTVPLPQRHMGDDSSITLGPQGGLGKGMSFRGQPSSVLSSTTDTSRIVDSRRSGAGLNGLSLGENIRHGSRADTMTSTEKFQGHPSTNQNRMPDTNNNSGVASSPSSQGQGRDFSDVEERLRDKSIAAIREFYSARDESEVALCIKDLKAVSFYPSMVSLWVTDSFERKAVERDLLANLLVNLTRPQHGMLSQVQLIKGFESALQCLEDAVNDAPKAPEYLGCIFGKAIAEDTVSLKDIGKIILEGGEEPGGLLEAGLAAVILESTLEMILSLKGETVLDEVWRNSNLRSDEFGPIRSKLLGRFI